MTKDEQALIDKLTKRSERWGKMTFGEIMDALDRQHEALTAIIAMKDDTLGTRGGDENVATLSFDRGCRMAFYRCADVAAKALNPE